MALVFRKLVKLVLPKVVMPEMVLEFRPAVKTPTGMRPGGRANFSLAIQAMSLSDNSVYLVSANRVLSKAVNTGMDSVLASALAVLFGERVSSRLAKQVSICKTGSVWPKPVSLIRRQVVSRIMEAEQKHVMRKEQATELVC